MARRVEFLTGYQNAAYAGAVQGFVEQVQPAESPLGKTALTEAVARYLFKLMAYKDEYEVARLHTDRGFQDKVDAMFEGDFKLNYHLAPPCIAKRTTRASCKSRSSAPAMLTGFTVLARLKGLRGTRAGHLRPHRGAPHRAGADRRVPRQHRGSAGRPGRRQPRRWRWRSPAFRSRSRATATSRSATWRRPARSGTT